MQPVQICPKCLKPLVPVSLCVCDHIRPLKTKRHVLIIQHPQEPDKELGSAMITHLSLPNSTLRIGLSWPNLKAALGREAMPSRWAILYLGSGVKSGLQKKDQLVLVDKKGAVLPDQEKIFADLEGIVVLDGTWSQAKTLWWRNAWMLKLRRAILIPAEKSLYKELRREPRGECLSTIESVAASLRALGEPEPTSKALRDVFGELLGKYRTKRAQMRAPKNED